MEPVQSQAQGSCKKSYIVCSFLSKFLNGLAVRMAYYNVDIFFDYVICVQMERDNLHIGYGVFVKLKYKCKWYRMMYLKQKFREQLVMLMLLLFSSF